MTVSDHSDRPYLLVLGCSQRKSSDPGEIPAFRRYQGVMWQTLRVALDAMHPAGRASLDVWFLSAQYGFQRADMPIPDYDRLMTPSRASELEALPTSNRHALTAAMNNARGVMIAAGLAYRESILRATRDRHLNRMLPALEQEQAGNETKEALDGIVPVRGGIGMQRQQLRQWIAAVDRIAIASITTPAGNRS